MEQHTRTLTSAYQILTYLRYLIENRSGIIRLDELFSFAAFSMNSTTMIQSWRWTLFHRSDFLRWVLSVLPLPFLRHHSLRDRNLRIAIGRYRYQVQAFPTRDLPFGKLRRRKNVETNHVVVGDVDSRSGHRHRHVSSSAELGHVRHRASIGPNVWRERNHLVR